MATVACGRGPGRPRARQAARRTQGAAARATKAPASASETAAMRTERIQREMARLFAPAGGVDRELYDADVRFEDPLTRLEGIGAYEANVRILATLFRPQLTVHAVAETGPDEVQTRWTMTLDLWFAGPIKPLWNPPVAFTGTSTYTFNPVTGRVASHVDRWDSIQSQGFLSAEAVLDVLREALTLEQTPQELETPSYELLQRLADYEIRRYAPFTVAEASTMSGDLTAGGGFSTLAEYIFGNDLAMTTPVFTTPSPESAGMAMQFPLEPSKVARAEAAPTPSTSAVRTRDLDVGIVAARRFGGIATESDAEREKAVLLAALKRDGIAFEPAQAFCARYNDPFTPPWARRNEVLVPLSEYAWPARWSPRAARP